ncbi:thioesterase family protein [Methylocella sp. CPCC 101449]|uniref:acyl-CoA thioesterase n=1 Tax=Methylocella sp. CPCC 101449 TaxID=2987531 RepID=UPI00288E4A23|nr:thioesterase family protein [Methylocella sp. CPCC 101449]MDT2021540.1 acyl-CoA thioesterase [Methylocella sp. CPCC 101449]HEV2571632.1 thioesterase family protein [Beijerinckiaceae bacterium]
MSKRYSYERLVHWGECDPAGIIFFPNYARWMVEGLNAFLLDLGFDPHGGISEMSIGGLPAVRSTFEYSAPAYLHARVVHAIEVKSLGAKSLTFAHTISQGEKILAKAEDVRVWVEFEPGGKIQSRAIPERLRALLAPYVAMPAVADHP